MRNFLCITLLSFLFFGCQAVDRNTQQVRQDIKTAKAEIDKHVATAFSTLGLPNLAKWSEDQIHWAIGTTAQETATWTNYIVGKAQDMAASTSIEIKVVDYRNANIRVNTPFGFVSVRNTETGEQKYWCIIPGATTIIEAGLESPIEGMKEEIDTYVANTFANFGFPTLMQKYDPLNVTGAIGSTLEEVNAWANAIVDTVNSNAEASVSMSIENYHTATMEIGTPFSFMSMRHKTTGEVRYFAIAPGFTGLIETSVK